MREPTSVVTGGIIDSPEAGTGRYERVRFEGTRFVGLSEMRGRISFEACWFVDCEFVDCNVDTAFCGALAYPESASLFQRTRFVRCGLADAYLGGARLEACEFEDCDFKGAIWNSLDLVDCTFRGVVSSINLSASSGPISRPPPFHRKKLPPRQNEITGNDFTQADLQGVGLRHGVPVHEQRWPQGPEFVILDRISERVAAALHALDGSTDPDARLTAVHLANEARTGQDSDLYRVDDPEMSAAHNRMVRLLTETELPP